MRRRADVVFTLHIERDATNSEPDRLSTTGVAIDLEPIPTAIKGIRFGEVRIVIQDGVVIQIDRMEKQMIRLIYDRTSSLWPVGYDESPLPFSILLLTGAPARRRDPRAAPLSHWLHKSPTRHREVPNQSPRTADSICQRHAQTEEVWHTDGS
jgi:hypothetical protein